MQHRRTRLGAYFSLAPGRNFRRRNKADQLIGVHETRLAGKKLAPKDLRAREGKTATARQLELGSNCRSLAAPEPILLKRAAASRPEGLVAWGFGTMRAAPTADQRPTRASRTGRLPSPGSRRCRGMFGAAKVAHCKRCASTAPRASTAAAPWRGRPAALGGHEPIGAI